MRSARVETVRNAVLADYRTPDGALPDIRVEIPAAGAEVIAR
jgi:hypothetical protein